MDSSDIYSILIFFGCLLFSAYFSSSETAFTSLRKNKLKIKVKNGEKKAEEALKLHAKYDNLLSTILIGNNIVNIASSSVATLFFVKFFPKYGAVISTVATTIILLIFAEITPKLIANIKPEKVAMLNVKGLKFIMFIFKPLVWLTSLWQNFVTSLLPEDKDEALSEDELLSYVDDAKIGGSIEYDEHILVKNAIEFDDVYVDSILTPRVDVVAIDIDSTDEEIEDIFDEYSYSRLVVYEKTVDNVLGIIHEKDFYRYMRKKIRFNEDIELKNIISDVLYIPGVMNLSELLKLMQKEKKHMAVIIDEHGGMEGIVTMEDVLEELVGDIWDETDDVELDIQTIVKDKTYIATGRCDLEDIFELLKIEDLEEYHSNTLSGFILEILGKMPEINDSFIFGKYKFIVKDVEGNRIEEVIISVVE